MNLAQLFNSAQRDEELLAAAAALREGRLDAAEGGLRARLKRDPTNVVAIRMLAEVAGQLGRYVDAERLLRRALTLAPEFHAARGNLVTVLHRQSKFTEARSEAERVIAAEPHDYGHLAQLAAVLVRIGEYAPAIAVYERILSRHADQVRLWVSYGHVLKTIGRQEDSVAAYREAIARAPAFGDAWWSLANLKTVQLTTEDIAVMEAALMEARTKADVYHLHFALGKALEDHGRFADAFGHYSEGNRQRREELPYDPDRVTRHVEGSCALLSASAFAARAGGGHPTRDPIFIVGLPRAGSTLVEQILASHSEVEGTMELSDIAAIAVDLGAQGGDGGGYLEHLLTLTEDQRHALGRRYLDSTRVQRKTQRPRFIDKMPNNFMHIGLIHLILPNAIIVDARRHPLATCVSCFKQHFSRGQGFTYDLAELGHYWRDYSRLMTHFDQVLPARVFRLQHESLVEHPEREIRALLAHCDLAFEPGCLSPHENARPVRTASSEQVRRPITSEHTANWRRFSPWLTPLRDALGEFTES